MEYIKAPTGFRYNQKKLFKRYIKSRLECLSAAFYGLTTTTPSLGKNPFLDSCRGKSLVRTFFPN